MTGVGSLDQKSTYYLNGYVFKVVERAPGRVRVHIFDDDSGNFEQLYDLWIPINSIIEELGIQVLEDGTLQLQEVDKSISSMMEERKREIRESHYIAMQSRKSHFKFHREIVTEATAKFHKVALASASWDPKIVQLHWHCPLCGLYHFYEVGVLGDNNFDVYYDPTRWNGCFRLPVLNDGNPLKYRTEVIRRLNRTRSRTEPTVCEFTVRDGIVTAVGNWVRELVMERVFSNPMSLRTLIPLSMTLTPSPQHECG